MDGLEILRSGGVEKWRAKLQEIGDRIATMPESAKPGVRYFGRYRNEVCDAPCLADELYVCMAGLWG